MQKQDHSLSPNKWGFTRIFLAIVFFCLLSTDLQAHAPNQSYIFLRVYEDGIEGRFEMTVKDIGRVFNLDLSKRMTLEELEPLIPRLQKYYLERVSFSTTAGNHAVQFDEITMMSIGLGDFVQLHFKLDGIDEVPDFLTIEYQALFDVDPTHRGIQVIEHNWKAGIIKNERRISLTFSPDNTIQDLDLTDSSVWNGFRGMIGSGMHHIFIGLDHVLFLLALLLPAVVIRKFNPSKPIVATDERSPFFPSFLQPYAQAWVPSDNFKRSLIYVIKIVTFFTIAHTITLSLAALEIVKLPSALVESIIALSIALAAFHNVYPLVKGKEWVIAFVFGLFHGFGFASVLGDLGLSGDYLTVSLLGFNIGVEVGQVIIVCIIFPILFFLAKTKLYKPILIYGSLFLVLVALNWFTDRSMGTDLPLDDFVERVYAKVLSVLHIYPV